MSNRAGRVLRALHTFWVIFMLHHVRTTFDIPEDLLEEAVRATHARSRREAVIAGLEELVRKARREELRSLAGKIDLDVDTDRSRKSRRR